MYCIYVHRNKINGKIYIGQTGQNPLTRWGKDGHRYIEKRKDGSYVHEHFARAIIKYGWNNFDHFVIFENLTKEQADNIESEMIKEADATNPDKGYNTATGGAHSGIKWSDEQRTKFHNSRLGHPPSIASINTIKETQGKKCKIVELNKEFTCSGDCAAFLGVTKGAIKNCLKGRNSTCKNYHIVYV